MQSNVPIHNTQAVATKLAILGHIVSNDLALWHGASGRPSGRRTNSSPVCTQACPTQRRGKPPTDHGFLYHGGHGPTRRCIMRCRRSLIPRPTACTSHIHVHLRVVTSSTGLSCQSRRLFNYDTKVNRLLMWHYISYLYFLVFFQSFLIQQLAVLWTILCDLVLSSTDCSNRSPFSLAQFVILFS